MTKKKIGIIAGIAAAVLILACVAVWFFFFREAAMPSDPNEIAYVNTVSDITQEGGLGMTTKFSGVAEPEKTVLQSMFRMPSVLNYNLRTAAV